MKYKYIIGIDEAGRGPLAGPVAVGAVLMLASFGRRFFSGVRDSKQLTEIQREKWFDKIKENKNVQYTVCFTGVGHIDKFGIASAIKKAVNKALKKLEILPSECIVLLDGSLKAPSVYKFQKTIIKGDEKKTIIALASIVAKVERDRKMKNFAKRYPKYNFERHKGYGTKRHYKKLKKYGACIIHRKSFLKNLSRRTSK